MTLMLFDLTVRRGNFFFFFFSIRFVELLFLNPGWRERFRHSRLSLHVMSQKIILITFWDVMSKSRLDLTSLTIFEVLSAAKG